MKNITKSMVSKFGPKKINVGTGRLVNSGASKGSKMLPGRAALHVLSNPTHQTPTDYAKLTPSGANAPLTYQSIIDMGMNAPKVAGDDEGF